MKPWPFSACKLVLLLDHHNQLDDGNINTRRLHRGRDVDTPRFFLPKTPFTLQTAFTREGGQVWHFSLFVTHIIVICVPLRCAEMTSIKDAFGWWVCAFFTHATRCEHEIQSVVGKIHYTRIIRFGFVFVCHHWVLTCKMIKGTEIFNDFYIWHISPYMILRALSIWQQHGIEVRESALMASWHGNTFPHYYTSVRGSHRSTVNFSHQGPVMRDSPLSLFFILYKLDNKQSNSWCFMTSRSSYGVTLFLLP